jgi:membrane-associated phospholipid phosphatase
VLACAAAAGGTTDLLKLLIARIRPHDFSFDGSVWATFQQFPGSGGQSFPSGHTATAAGLAAGLIWLYPQGRLLFSLLTVLVGCQRIVSGAHYPSDVLVGAAVGCFVAQFILYVGRLPVSFDRWEKRWRSN